MALTKKHGNFMVKSPIFCSFHANFWSTPPGLGTDRRSLRPPQPRKMSRPGETPKKTKRERHYSNSKSSDSDSNSGILTIKTIEPAPCTISWQLLRAPNDPPVSGESPKCP